MPLAGVNTSAVPEKAEPSQYRPVPTSRRATATSCTPDRSSPAVPQTSPAEVEQPASHSERVYEVEAAGKLVADVGAVVSTVQVQVAAGPVLPAGSVAVTEKLWVPSARPL